MNQIRFKGSECVGMKNVLKKENIGFTERKPF
jgi:hypothetical protein